MPVFHGWDLVGETLRSIRDQDFDGYRVLISVDGDDQRSADACAPFLEDPRFTMVIQPVRLGWAANLNWLMARCDADYFCYWQQDDLCPPNYLRTLYGHAATHPETASVYADVQWFGGRFDRNELPSVTGTPLQRALYQLEEGHFAPFRGLVRLDALRGAGPLRVTPYDSRVEDIVWVIKLAAQGEGHRVTDTLYFKRLHGGNTHSAPRELPRTFMRGAWLEFGLGVLEALLPLFPAGDRGGAPMVVLERLAVLRPERWAFYDPWQGGPADWIRFANEFLDAATLRFDAPVTPGFPGAMAFFALLKARRENAAQCHSERCLLDLAMRHEWLRSLAAAVSQAGCCYAQLRPEEACPALLESGWSVPEPWGTQMVEPVAFLRLPIPDRAAWKVTLTGRGMAESALNVRFAGQSWPCAVVAADAIRFEIEGTGTPEGMVVELESTPMPGPVLESIALQRITRSGI